MQKESFESQSNQLLLSENNGTRNLVSIDDFKESSLFKRSQANNFVDIGSIDINLSFNDPNSKKPLCFDETAQFQLNKDQARHLDFGDIRELFNTALEPLEQAIIWVNSGVHGGKGDNSGGGNRGGGENSLPGSKPGRDHSGHCHKPPADDKPAPGDVIPPGEAPPPTADWSSGFLFGGNAHNSLASLESAIGGRANLEMFPVHPGNEHELQHVRDDLATGVTPEISLNGEFFAKGSRGIVDGEYDRQLKQMARELSHMKGQDGKQANLLLRFGKEMNLQHAFVGSGHDFIAAYQHVADIFHREAPNVKMVWCPTAAVDPTELGREPDASKYWPGARYVDVVGPDGYSKLHGRERSFRDIFEPFVQFSQRIGKPFMTSETNDKTPVSDSQSAQWWRDAYQYISDLRSRGVNILGVGLFSRNEGEILSEAEKQALRATFLKIEGH